MSTIEERVKRLEDKVFGPVIPPTPTPVPTPTPIPTPTIVKDRFGSPLKYKPASTALKYESTWDNGVPRTINAVNIDPADPIVMIRGKGTVSIDGKGIATMKGDQPRFYFTKKDGSFAIFRNVELTFYFRRISDGNEGYAGATASLRSKHHSSEGKGVNSVYARMENDGNVAFPYEEDHPAIKATMAQKKIWSSLPKNKWMGYKFTMVDTLKPDGTIASINYRLFVDESANETGDFKEILNYVDKDTNRLQRLNTKGCVFVRNTEVTEWQYKKLSIYEVVP